MFPVGWDFGSPRIVQLPQLHGPHVPFPGQLPDGLQHPFPGLGLQGPQTGPGLVGQRNEKAPPPEPGTPHQDQRTDPLNLTLPLGQEIIGIQPERLFIYPAPAVQQGIRGLGKTAYSPIPKVPSFSQRQPGQSDPHHAFLRPFSGLRPFGPQASGPSPCSRNWIS